MQHRLAPFRKLYIVSGTIVVIALVITLLTVRANHNERSSKAFLGQKLNSLPIPETCVEKARQYTPGGVDTRSGWDADYICNTTGGSAYDFIRAGLAQQGFTSYANTDYSLPGPSTRSIFYSFEYTDARVNASYRFLPEVSIAASNPEALRRTSVTGMRIDVKRAWK